MRRKLTRNEVQAEALISQWAEWVRHERRAIAGGYGSIFKESGGGFEEQLPAWVSIEDVQLVNGVYLRYVTPDRRPIIELAWGIDRVALESCRLKMGGMKTTHQAKYLRVGKSRYHEVLSDFRSAVVLGFDGVE